MEVKIQDKANIGIVTFMAYPIANGTGPVEQSISTIANDAYFQLLEITHIANDNVRANCQKITKEKNKKIYFGSQPNILMNKLNLNHFEEKKRSHAIATIKKDIDEAYSWNALSLMVLSGKDPGVDMRKTALSLLIDSLKQLCEYSVSKSDMPITLEAFDRVEFGKNCLIGPSEETAEVAEKVRKDFPSFGILSDLSHIPLLNETSHQCLNILKDYITHVHVGNCVMKNTQHPAYGDNHPRFGIIDGENGVDELARFLTALAEIGFFNGSKKPLSFELKPAAAESPTEIIIEAQQFLDKAWEKA